MATALSVNRLLELVLSAVSKNQLELSTFWMEQEFVLRSATLLTQASSTEMIMYASLANTPVKSATEVLQLVLPVNKTNLLFMRIH